MVKKYELPLSWHPELMEYADTCGVKFMTTPFSLEIVDELNRMGVKAFKVASGDLTFIPSPQEIRKLWKTNHFVNRYGVSWRD